MSCRKDSKLRIFGTFPHAFSSSCACRFYKDRLDWVSDKSVLLQVFEKIVEVQAQSTASTEFSAACQPFLDRGILPPLATKFWFHQAPDNEEGYNTNFVIYLEERLNEHLKHPDPKYLKPPAQLGEVSGVWNRDLKVKIFNWNLEDEPTQPSDGIETKLESQGLPPWFLEQGFESYFPSIICPIDNCFHSLNTHWGFDSPAYKKDGSFLLHPSCQPPVNNRDNELPSLLKPMNKNSYDFGLFDYVVGAPKAEGSSNHDLSITGAHHFLCKRVRREDTPEGAPKNNLAPFTHTMKVQSTGDRPYDRWSGEKVLGDPVDVIARKEDLESLFEYLTVSAEYFEISSFELLSEYFESLTFEFFFLPLFRLFFRKHPGKECLRLHQFF